MGGEREKGKAWSEGEHMHTCRKGGGEGVRRERGEKDRRERGERKMGKSRD